MPSPTATPWLVGAATRDITPPNPQFLYGYPHVPRTSTGVHDRLECAALYVAGREGECLFISSDLIVVSKAQAAAIRRGIQARTGVQPSAIMVAVTHNHSGPVTVGYVSNAADPTVPPPDEAYLDLFIAQAIDAGSVAVKSARPATLQFARALSQGIGTNRHDPSASTDPEVPVLLAKDAQTGTAIGCLLVCAMHPTVLHEDSTLVSADFPHFTRAFLRAQALGLDCPVVFLQGASGDQSPRHVVTANTFAEARRIGEILGRAIAAALSNASELPADRIRTRSAALELTPRTTPSIESATRDVAAAREQLASLRARQAPRPAVRTAECDLFGAEETAALALAAQDGRLAKAITGCMPAEIQVIEIGGVAFVGWPGEFFVEYALAVRGQRPNAFVVTLANGELQGYVTTVAAAEHRFYEAGNAVFGPENGRKFVETTLALLPLN